MRVSAYIPAYNSLGTLAKALASVRQQTQPVAELFVIDDGSTDGTADLAKSLQVPVVRLAENQGRGKARAIALASARHEMVLCCDAAVQLSPDFLVQAQKWFTQPQVAAVCGRVTRAPNRTAAERWRNRHLFKSALRPPLDTHASLATGGALLRRPAILKVGNFDERLRQSEDADLGRRLLAGGYDVVFDPCLQMEALGSNSLWQALERYYRWNIPQNQRLTASDYLRQIVYSVKFMSLQDLAQRDVGAVSISLLWPWYLFWKHLTRRENY